MEKIKVLIVEDSGLIAEDIASRLKNHSMEVIGIYAQGEDAIDSLDEAVPDLIIMDIQLAGAMDGISTAQVINENFSIPIIYLSDHIDTNLIERAKKTFPASYLQKPFNEGELVRVLEIAFTNWQERKERHRNILRNHIFIRDGQSYIKLSYNDIIYLQADRAYCNIVTEQKTYIQSNNMSYVLGQLNHRDFVQVHRSSVINANKITEIEGNIIRLGEHKVEMSKGMREDLIGKLKFLK